MRRVCRFSPRGLLAPSSSVPPCGSRLVPGRGASGGDGARPCELVEATLAIVDAKFPALRRDTRYGMLEGG